MGALAQRKASPGAPGYCLAIEADRTCGLVGTSRTWSLNEPVVKSKHFVVHKGSRGWRLRLILGRSVRSRKKLGGRCERSPASTSEEGMRGTTGAGAHG